MELRHWNAIGWGAVAMIASFFLIWMRTQWMLETVIVFSVTVYFVVVSLLLLVTEPKEEEKPERPVTRRDRRAVTGQFKMYTFKRR